MTAASPRTRSDRAELLDLLLERGILRRSDTQPVLSRDGSSARWMLESLAVTLTPRGAELAGRLIAERLKRFDGRQVATYGLTAVPILQSALLQSGGLYNGLLIRSERKAHGSRKLIEGPINPHEPVIMIEDSIASGTSVKEGMATLEAAGLRVEGCIALVRFGWDGGCSSLCEQGYHVEAIYDIFEDFMSRMDGESGPDYNPTKDFEGLHWSQRRATENLHPAGLAREVLREYLASGEVLRAPMRLDRDDYDSRGGAWVSLRSRDDIYDRIARDGFWHFPCEKSWGAPEDIVRAAFRTAQELPQGQLDSCHIGVTLFSPLEEVTVGELDNDRYGIVVVSRERPEVMGGALPHMPGIRGEWQQFRHARFNNAKLYPHEHFIIYRHGVAKFIEPGAPWQPSGVANDAAEPDLSDLASYTFEFVKCAGGASFTLRGALAPPVQLPATANQIFVTIYIDGEIRGCMGSDDLADIHQTLRTLAQAAMQDERFADIEQDPDSSLAASVSLLYNELHMGGFSREEVRLRYRNGQQALKLEQGARKGLLLPLVATRMSLDAEDFVDEVIDKAGITREPYDWIRYDCTTWLADGEGVWKLDGALRQATATLKPDELAALHLEYLERNQRPDGGFYFGYQAFANTLYQGIDVARQAHAVWTLARAGRFQAGSAALQFALAQTEDPALDLSRDAFVLLATSIRGMRHEVEREELAGKLLNAIDRHGRVQTWRPSEEDEEQNDFEPDELQNYVPGQVLLALASTKPQDPRVAQAFRYYRHRFHHKRNFGQVSWMALAAAAWRESEFVFEIADWILQFQQAKTGAFITDHQPDTPGFTTAVYLEAVGAAYHTAVECAPSRCRRYDDAWQRGIQFLDRLIIQDRDSSLLPNCGYAAGGVRENLYSGHVRIDFVQHALCAILGRYPEIQTNTKGENQHHG